MNFGDIVTLIIAIITSGAFFGFAQFMITRWDNKKNIEKKIDALAAGLDEHKATLARTHILRFADEQRSGVIHHSDEYFRQQILDIDVYERYCEAHPDFANGLTKMASEYIREEYKRLYLNNEGE